MPSLGPLSGAPLSDEGGDAPIPPDLFPDIASGANCYDDPHAIFLNVLEDAIEGSFPSGDAIILNLLESGFSGSDIISGVAAAFCSVSANIADAAVGEALPNLIDRAQAVCSAQANGTFVGNLSDAGTLSDAIRAAWAMLVEDEGDIGDDTLAIVKKLVAIAETLYATGAVAARLDAMVAAAVAGAIQAETVSGWSLDAADSGAIGDAANGILAAILNLADAGQATDSASGALSVVLVATDDAVVADSPAAALSALCDLSDGAMVFCTLRLNGFDYQGWVLNTDLRALTEYRNVPFDSFAILNGRTYAAGEGGIYELAGDTDDGEPIAAWFRPFLTDFTSDKLKGVSDIWLGTSGTDLYVKVHTKDPATGLMAEDIYPVQHFHGDGSDKGRVKVGRGLKSQWWALTVGNENGADFAVETITWLPLLRDRRQ